MLENNHIYHKRVRTYTCAALHLFFIRLILFTYVCIPKWYITFLEPHLRDTCKSHTAFTKSMETQIHVLIFTPIFPPFTILVILLIGNIHFLLNTKYQTLLSNTLEVMAISMTQGWIPKSTLSLFELKSTFSFVIWNLDFKYRFLIVNCDW